MQNNFLEYIQKNGPEAFDKMAADLAKQLNDAKAQYEADQKKKAEEAKKAENRETMVKQLVRLMKFYFGEGMPVDQYEMSQLVMEAAKNIVRDDQKKNTVESKMEVVRDEDIPGGHVKVMRGDLSDLSDEELRDFWNGFVDNFFDVGD